MTPQEIQEAQRELGLNNTELAELLGFRSGLRKNLKHMGNAVKTGKRPLMPEREKLLRNALQEKENGK